MKIENKEIHTIPCTLSYHMLFFCFLVCIGCGIRLWFTEGREFIHSSQNTLSFVFIMLTLIFSSVGLLTTLYIFLIISINQKLFRGMNKLFLYRLRNNWCIFLIKYKLRFFISTWLFSFNKSWMDLQELTTLHLWINSMACTWFCDNCNQQSFLYECPFCWSLIVGKYHFKSTTSIVLIFNVGIPHQSFVIWLFSVWWTLANKL